MRSEAPALGFGTGNLRVVTLALPLSRADVRSTCVWASLAYKLHLAAKHAGAPMTQIVFQRSIRAVIPSVAARSSRGRGVIFGLPIARRRRA